MANDFVKLRIILRSARVVLWLPIIANVSLLTISLRRSIWEALILGISLSCIAAYGFLINDLQDLQGDKSNKAGRLDSASNDVLSDVKYSAILFLISGITLTAILQPRSVFALLVIAGGLTAYTFWIRPKLCIANLLAALLASSPLWLPNIVFLQPPGATQIAVLTIAVVMLVGREILFDVADRFGDAKMNRRTLPMFLGDQIAQRIAVAMQFGGCFLLLVVTVARAHKLFFSFQLLLYVTCVVLICLVVSANMKLTTQPISASLKQIIAARTRIAMLLLPILLFLLLSK